MPLALSPDNQSHDCRDEAVATPRDVDDELISVLPITQRATQGRHMNREICRLDKGIRPNPSHQVFLTDQLAAAFKQRNQDLQSTASKGNLLVAIQQEKLRRKQSKRSECRSRCLHHNLPYFDREIRRQRCREANLRNRGATNNSALVAANECFGCMT